MSNKQDDGIMNITCYHQIVEGNHRCNVNFDTQTN